MTDYAVVADFFLGMTVHAKTHVDFCNRNYTVHRLDRTMARLASHARVDMWSMAEANEIRKRVNPIPLDFERGLIVVSPRPRHGLNSARQAATVASDASLNRRNTGIFRAPRVFMAELTRDLIHTSVDTMAERDRLNDVGSRRPRTLGQRDGGCSEN